MVRVVEREEPEERAFADVEAAVRRDYIAGHGQEAWRSIMEQMLEENDFKLNEAGLDAMDPRKATPGE
jgi:hypothetical protein